MLLSVKNITDFRKHVDTAGNKLVVVDFYASWCGPCKQVAQKLEELSNKYSDKCIVLKVDVEEVEDLADEYHISTMPNLIFLKNGEKIDGFTGASQSKLDEYFAKYIITADCPV